MIGGRLHRELPSTTDRPGGLAGVWIKSAFAGWRGRSQFADLERYCMFVGYPRSGHTLIGALLNAHPEMVIANELDAVGYVHAGFRGPQLFAMLLDRDRAHTDGGSQWAGYAYQVPGQWQGKYRKLRVIGDKKGGRSSFRIGAHRDLLAKVRQAVGLPMRVIHEVRNPFDNIATLLLKQHRRTLPECIGMYAGLLETNRWVRDQLGESLLTIRHEDLVASPNENVEVLCRFLGVTAENDYLAACAQVVFESPRKTRSKIDWDAKNRKAVDSLIAEFDFLRGYDFGL